MQDIKELNQDSIPLIIIQLYKKKVFHSLEKLNEKEKKKQQRKKNNL
jgi:hypothetical protein